MAPTTSTSALTPVIGRFIDLSNAILGKLRARMSRNDFLESISRILAEHAECDSVDWWLSESGAFFRLEVRAESKGRFVNRIEKASSPPKGAVRYGDDEAATLESLYQDIIDGHYDPDEDFFTLNGTFWTKDTSVELSYTSPKTGLMRRCDLGGDYASIILMPLMVDEQPLGFVQFGSNTTGHFNAGDALFYEVIAATLAVAVANQRAQWLLRERIKEMSCLYGVMHLAARPGASLDEVLQDSVELLPAAWQHPQLTEARIVIDGREFKTAAHRPSKHLQIAPIYAAGALRGHLEIVYSEAREESQGTLFLEEERALIDALAREIGGVIERRAAREEMARLEDQLRHADRLATIGQLAAGVAHELNEPLSTVLGFAQLALKAELPGSAERDVNKIVDAALRARDIVSKLRLFARQTPATRAKVDLNEVVHEALFFIEARCARQNIEVIRELEPQLGAIVADRGQLHQVFVNLVVNAVQAMEEGGTLTVRTRSRQDEVALFVIDTGVGMPEKVREQIFVPFFTTKDVDQGTGLGLSVVHGIVASHGGVIEVMSQSGAGTTFEIRLPRDAEKTVNAREKH